MGIVHKKVFVRVPMHTYIHHDDFEQPKEKGLLFKVVSVEGYSLAEIQLSGSLSGTTHRALIIDVHADFICKYSTTDSGRFLKMGEK